jgi:hypothetical protein
MAEYRGTGSENFGLVVGMDFEQSEFAFDNLQGGTNVGGLERDIGDTKNFIARRYFDEQFGHAVDGHVALAGGRDVSRRLGLQAIDIGVSA